jgi:hypothetical protein
MDSTRCTVTVRDSHSRLLPKQAVGLSSPLNLIRPPLSIFAALAFICIIGCRHGTEPSPPAPDTIAPQIDIATPGNPACTRTPSVVLDGKASDNIGVRRITFRFDSAAENDVPITPGAVVSFNTTMTPPAGLSKLTVTAYDASGNSTRVVSSVRYSVSRLIAARQGLRPPSPIVVIDSDGDCRRQVGTAFDFPVDWPAGAWDPTQTRLVFQTGDSLQPFTHLYMTALDGKGARLLSEGRFVSEDSPQFTADGQWIYFSAGNIPPGAGGIVYAVWRIHPDGSGLQQVTSTGDANASYKSPSPSPDGSRAVIIAGSGLQILDVATRRLTPLGVVGQSPRWSPTGSSIAFIDQGPRNDGLGVVTVINSDGSGKRAISPDGVAYTVRVSWARDGLSVLVQNYTSGRLEVIGVMTTTVTAIPNSTSLFGAEW